jgi:hypothetical protein
METKLMQKSETKKLPAGILEGTEAFWHEGEKWVLHEGKAMRFNEAPVKVQNMIAMAFLKDKGSRAYLKKIGFNAFSKAFDFWYKCVIGSLDEIPDFKDGNFTPDAYNRTCTDYSCPHRGIFCSIKPGLKNYEVATISALKGGFTLEKTAELLCISLPGLKSRIERIKEKLGATNMASLIARADAYGI